MLPEPSIDMPWPAQIPASRWLEVCGSYTLLTATPVAGTLITHG